MFNGAIDVNVHIPISRLSSAFSRFAFLSRRRK